MARTSAILLTRPREKQDLESKPLLADDGAAGDARAAVHLSDGSDGAPCPTIHLPAAPPPAPPPPDRTGGARVANAAARLASQAAARAAGARAYWSGLTTAGKIKWITTALILILILTLEGTLGLHRYYRSLLSYCKEHPLPGFIIYTCVCCVGTVALLGTSVFAYVAGAIFGFPLGFFSTWIGLSLGQVVCFLLGQRLLRGVALRLFGSHPLFTTLGEVIKTDGFVIILLLRLVWVIPYSFVNLACPVLGARLDVYAAASTLGIIPEIALEVYLGSVALSARDMIWGPDGLSVTGAAAVLGGVAVLAAFLVAAVWVMRRALHRRMGAGRTTGDLELQLQSDGACAEPEAEPTEPSEPIISLNQCLGLSADHVRDRTHQLPDWNKGSDAGAATVKLAPDATAAATADSAADLYADAARGGGRDGGLEGPASPLLASSAMARANGY